MPAPFHAVIPCDQMQAGSLGAYDGHARGLARTTLLDRSIGSVHVGYAICELAAGGVIDRCLHAFEKALYVLSGALQLERDGHLVALSKDDFGLVPTGTPHALRNVGDSPTRWVEVCAPQPKPPGGWQDTFFVDGPDWANAPGTFDPADPRTKLVGRYDGTMPPGVVMHGDLRGFSIKHFMDRESERSI